MRPIFLIGYMGSGKSTLGRAVARLTGLDFVDLDLYIEGRFHRSVRQLFEERGEEAFRRIEREMLGEVAGFSDVVVSCGGGTPCHFDNMEVMNRSGLTVFLDVPVAALHRRLLRGRHKRPLIASMGDDELLRYIVESLDKRMPYYSQAAERFSTAHIDRSVDKEEAARQFVARFVSKPFINDDHTSC